MCLADGSLHEPVVDGPPSPGDAGRRVLSMPDRWCPTPESGSPDRSGWRERFPYWVMSILIWLTLRGLQSNVPFLVGVTRTNLPFSTFVRT